MGGGGGGFEVAMVVATSTLDTATPVVFDEEVGAVTASKIRGRFRVVLFAVVAVLVVVVVVVVPVVVEVVD